MKSCFTRHRYKNEDEHIMGYTPRKLHKMDTTTIVESNLTNNSSNISVPPDHMDAPIIPLYVFVLVTMSYSLVFLAGILGNVLVILVVALFSDMRTSTNVYLANLSVADFLVLLICLPTALTEFHSEEVWHLGDFLCKFF